MRMRKNLTPMTLEEHQKVATFLLSFLSHYEESAQIIRKGFSETSPVVKKLEDMYELGSFLKYSLQQGADLHRSKLEVKPGDENYDKWSRVYLGE